MWILTNGGDPTGHVGDWLFTGASYTGISSAEDIEALVAAGSINSDQPRSITASQHARWRTLPPAAPPAPA
jgi:hypothetical protein